MKPVDMAAADINAEYLGVPRLSLMENAWRAVAEEIGNAVDEGRVAIFCGSGGNGGDGFVAARHLLNMGFDVEVQLLGHPERIVSEEALVNWKVLGAMQPHPGGFMVEVVRDSSEINPLDADVVVDAILGTGVRGSLREPSRSAIEIINRSDAFRVSVDIPSGLNPETGAVDDIAVSADLTVIFHRMKDGLTVADPAVTGEIVVRDIGIPPAAAALLGPGDLLRMPSRRTESHKSENGRVFIIGGSRQYSGAPAIAAKAALRAGADIVMVAAPESAARAIRSLSPDIIVRELDGGYIGMESLDEILELAEKSDSVLMGCGAGRETSTARTFLRVIGDLHEMEKPLILDADALRLMDYSDVSEYRELTVTPHMAEFRSFFKLKSMIFDDFRERVSAFQSVSSRIMGTVLLKGRIDMIFQGDRSRLNKTGCPGMTVGGTGDALAGLTAGLRSLGLSSFDSASLAAFINGMAGELAMERYGNGFTASDMLDMIPPVMDMGFYGF